ncbi:pyridoxal phosphate-dependent aminotransferase [Phenylobacterium sp.]|uniref:pyridoxal phosphate-dependent aminotransferase n=1 Tax=Phenylobacterium sp. TaxID=1871053 RepID=UPI002730B108|nr:pyridoxal phosphate-dependent aminotransferase [Phenylobacterium sp.]MDP1875880.1 pyridoxal phosphate-dependent aminotransferase [Phenylobacterium sp.]
MSSGVAWPSLATGGGISSGLEGGYTAWVREVLRAVAAEPRAAVLFDSTIKEPTELLARVVGEAFRDGITDRYESTFAGGNRYVAAAVAERYGVEADQVICTTGATSAMAMAVSAFVKPGDHVIVEAPAFDLLPALAHEAQAKVTPLPRRAPDFAIDVEALSAMVRRDTRLIMLTQVHNPSGAVLDVETLRAIGEIAAKVGARVLIDEVYADFADEGSAVRVSEVFVSAGSLTKVQGLFALKCGWAVGSAANIATIQAANPQGDQGVSKLAHAIGALVLENMAPFEAHWRGVLSAARPVLGAHAQRMIDDGLILGAPPPYGCMYFPQVVGVDDTLELASWLWTTEQIVVAPGEFFGQPGHVRIGFGGDAAALDDGLGRLHDALLRRRRPG